MLRQNLKSARQAGFTLVELAIVMIIIGLLIGGVLKGQELVANAQVTATIAQIKGVDAATTTFRDIYSAMPGDLGPVGVPATRLPNCTGNCALAGNGNGRVDNAGAEILFSAAQAQEQIAYWAHLAAADLITGVIPTSAEGAGTATWGGALPAAKIGGGYYAGYHNVGALNGLIAGTTPRAGLYLALHNTPTSATVAADFALNPSQAARIDTKVDDGKPNTGSTVAIGASGAANCASATTAVALYNEALPSALCNLYIRIQN